MTKSLVKTLMIFGALIFAVMFITGIIQSFKLSALQTQLQTAQERAEQMQEKYADAEEEIAYKNSEQYVEDYYKQEEKYGTGNDKIYELKD